MQCVILGTVAQPHYEKKVLFPTSEGYLKERCRNYNFRSSYCIFPLCEAYYLIPTSRKTTEMNGSDVITYWCNRSRQLINQSGIIESQEWMWLLKELQSNYLNNCPLSMLRTFTLFALGIIWDSDQPLWMLWHMSSFKDMKSLPLALSLH